MTEPKLVSVIIPTRNSAATLEACLKSVRAQDYPAIELIVVDRDSTDETKAIAARYNARVFNQGPERSAQRNFGVRQAAGEYVLIIDSDMELSSNALSACLRVMNAESAAIVLPEESFGEGFWAQCKALERSFYQGIPWMEAARFFRREDFLRLNGYDEKLVSGEDWDLSQRMQALGSIARAETVIYHNEGRLRLYDTLKKKMYYAKLFAQYAEKKEHAAQVGKQTGIIARYAIFFREPRRLLANPITGSGMLFMKTCEFAAGGCVYLAARIRQKL